MKYKYDAELVRIIDGDTFEILAFMGLNMRAKIRVRLLGVDTHELGGKYDDEAEREKNFVDGWFRTHETVLVSPEDGTKQDSFGRWLFKVKDKHGNSLGAILREEFDGVKYIEE